MLQKDLQTLSSTYLPPPSPPPPTPPPPIVISRTVGTVTITYLNDLCSWEARCLALKTGNDGFKNSFIPGGTLTTHLVAPKKRHVIIIMVGKNLQCTKLKLYIIISTSVMLILFLSYEAMLLFMGLNCLGVILFLWLTPYY